MTSSAVIMPRSPWLVGRHGEERRRACRSEVAAILRPIWPDLPEPGDDQPPLAPLMRSAAAVKGRAEIGIAARPSARRCRCPRRRGCGAPIERRSRCRMILSSAECGLAMSVQGEALRAKPVH